MCERCAGAVTDYLGAVLDQLRTRHVRVLALSVPTPDPHTALCGRLEIDPVTPTGVCVSRRVSARWHEELGWSVERLSATDFGKDRRYLHHELTPTPRQVARFISGLVHGENLGEPGPQIHRYRLLADHQQLLERLTHPANTHQTAMHPAGMRA